MAESFFGIRLGLKGTGEFKSGLEGAKRDVASFRQEAGKMSSMMSGGGMVRNLGALVGGAAIKQALTGLTDFADKIVDLSDRFGVPLKTLQEWGTAAEQNGSSLESLAGGFNKLIINQSKALQGDEALRESFANLGVSVQDLQTMTPERLMEKISESGLEAADVVAVLGRNGMELVPVLRALADGSAEFGKAMDDATIRSLADAADQLKLFQQHSTSVFGSVIAGASKVLASFNLLAQSPFAALFGGKGAGAFSALPGELKEVWSPTAEGGGPPQTRDMEQQAVDERGRKAEETSAKVAANYAADQIKLHQRAAEIRRESALKELETQERIAAIKQEIADLDADIDNAKSGEADVRRAELEKDLAEATAAATKEKAAAEKEAAQEVDKANKAREQWQEDRERQAREGKDRDVENQMDDQRRERDEMDAAIDEKLKHPDQRREEKRAQAKRDRIEHGILKAKKNREETDDKNQLDNLDDLRKEPAPDKAEEKPGEGWAELAQEIATLKGHLEQIEKNTKDGLSE